MIEKIKKLAQSPAIGSDLDIKNFAKIMELSEDDVAILFKSKEIIKKYYLTNEILIQKGLFQDHLIKNFVEPAKLNMLHSISKPWLFVRKL